MERPLISLRLKQFALRIVIGIVHAGTLLVRGIATIGRATILQPLRLLGRAAIQTSLPLYRLLFNARHRTFSTKTTRVGTNLIGVLTGKSAVHAAIVVLTITVMIGNFTARGAGLSEVAGNSVLEKVVSANPEEGDVIERAPVPKVAYVNRQNAISSEVSFEAELGDVADLATAITADGNALQTPIVSADGIQQRSDVTMYLVQGGDTIGGIANRFGVTQRTILAANNLTNADFIKPGQELLIPPITGVIHKVVKGDTIASIAQQYKVDPQDILDFNHLADASAISVGQSVMVPGGEIPLPELPASGQIQRPRSGLSAPVSVPQSAPAVGGGRLNWPTNRRGINQYFRYGHTGIDAECKLGDALYAAKDGVVSAVLYQSYGYGYHIIVDHGSFDTLYGHASKIFVRPGQRVSRGQTIAMCGSTGRSTGTHVHFEVRINGRPVNPLSYL